MLKTIFPLVRGAALTSLLVLAGGCGFDIFEKVVTDPHPPAMLNFQYGPANIATGDTIVGTFTFVDNGADIETLEMRDLSGSGTVSPTPPAEPTFDEDGNPILDEDGNPVLEVPSVFFFPGTTGTTEWQLVLNTNQAGAHTIKVWLEDSQESRSEPVFMEVFVTP